MESWVGPGNKATFCSHLNYSLKLVQYSVVCKYCKTKLQVLLKGQSSVTDTRGSFLSLEPSLVEARRLQTASSIHSTQIGACTHSGMLLHLQKHTLDGSQRSVQSKLSIFAGTILRAGNNTVVFSPPTFIQFLLVLTSLVRTNTRLSQATECLAELGRIQPQMA